MRKIVTAVSAAALSLSMLSAAVPALAVTGYDSAYAGESAFVNISPGQTQNFQVFFANTGTTTWSKGTSTQVDLAACQHDKVTCNSVASDVAAWNSGWLSTTRYATTTQTTTAPGSLGTFSYNVAAPSNALAGNYRFNGDLVLSSTGDRIHPEGYYQDATIGGGGGAATLTSLTPNNGPTTGGTSVSISGSGFVCTPAFPAVAFGATNAAVTSCGGTSVVATSPAGAKGSVTVTVTNSGAAASNGLTFTYVDLTPPQFTAMSVASNVVTVTYSKPVCRMVAFVAGQTDWAVKNVTNSTNDALTGDNTPTCDSATAPTTGVTTANLFLTTALPPGAFVEVDLNQNTPALPAINPTPALAAGTCKPATLSTCNTNFIDSSGNTIMAPQGQTASAQSAPGGAPTITSASGAVGTSTVTVNFSQAVFCPAATNATVPGHFSLSSGGTGDPTITGYGSTACPSAQQGSITAFKLATSKTLPSNTTYTLTFTPTANNEITNVFNVSLVNPPGTASVTFTTGAADVTPPIIVDADITAKSTGGSDYGFAGDTYVLTFSKKMDGTGTNGCSSGATSCTISIQDQDGTTATVTCGGKVSCTWDTGATNLTVAVTTTLTGPNTTGCLTPPGPCDISAGTTPGMAIPFSITAISGMWDASTNKNPVNILGSTDRLVEYPSEAGG